MKCVGAHNPPCARCAKVGRKCVIAPVNPGPQTISQTISPYSSTKTINAWPSQDMARPVVYPLTPVVDTRHHDHTSVYLHWEPNQSYSTMSQPILPSMPEVPSTTTDNRRPQTWNEIQRHPMSASPISWTCTSLQSPEIPTTNMQYIPSTSNPTPSLDVTVSSLSLPVTPRQDHVTIVTPSSRNLPSAEDLSHLCRL